MTYGKYFLVVIVLSMMFGNLLIAQIGVGPEEYTKLDPGKFSQADLSELKSTKTVFLYRKDDKVEELEKAIKSVWTLTEISLIPYSDIDKIDFSNTSIFSLGGFNTNTWNISSGMNYDNTHIYLSLWMSAKEGKGKKAKKTFCRIELHPTFEDYTFVTTEDDAKIFNYLYSKATLKNWKTGFLKAYLQNVNDYLEKESERWLFLNEADKELKELSKKTLFIPDYLFVKFDMFSGDESKRLNTDKILKSYPYKYKILKADDLSDKILESTEAFYYLVYVKSSTDKYLTIYNSQTGKIVYSSYHPVSYNVKKSDFKTIAEAINK